MSRHSPPTLAELEDLVEVLPKAFPQRDDIGTICDFSELDLASVPEKDTIEGQWREIVKQVIRYKNPAFLVQVRKRVPPLYRDEVERAIGPLSDWLDMASLDVGASQLREGIDLLLEADLEPEELMAAARSIRDAAVVVAKRLDREPDWGALIVNATDIRGSAQLRNSMVARAFSVITAARYLVGVIATPPTSPLPSRDRESEDPNQLEAHARIRAEAADNLLRQSRELWRNLIERVVFRVEADTD